MAVILFRFWPARILGLPLRAVIDIWACSWSVSYSVVATAIVDDTYIDSLLVWAGRVVAMRDRIERCLDDKMAP